MDATPIQKYALRLLMASGQIEMPDFAAWQHLQRESASAFLAPFGGPLQAISNAKITRPRKPVSNTDDAFTGSGQSIPRKKSDMEIR